MNSNIMVKPKFQTILSYDKAKIVSRPFNYQQYMWSGYVSSEEYKITRFLHGFYNYLKLNNYEVSKYGIKGKSTGIRIKTKFFTFEIALMKPHFFFMLFNPIRVLQRSQHNLLLYKLHNVNRKLVLESMNSDDFLSALRKGINLLNNYFKKYLTQLNEDDKNFFDTNYLERHFNSPETVSLLDISFTADIFFNNDKQMQTVLNHALKINNGKYLRNVIEEDNVYFKPYNKILDKKRKDLPEIRLYKKGKELKYQFNEKRRLLLKNNKKPNRKQELKNLKDEWKEVLEKSSNVLRIEVEFNGKESIKSYFGSSLLSDVLGNKTLQEVLNDVISNNISNYYIQYLSSKDIFYVSIFNNSKDRNSEVIEDESE